MVTVPASADVRWILRLLAARRQEPGLSYVATGPVPGVVGKHTMALSSVCTGRALFQVRGGQRNVDQNQFSDSELACAQSCEEQTQLENPKAQNPRP